MKGTAGMPWQRRESARWVRDTSSWLAVEVVLFDPVPGPFNRGEDEEIDLTGLAESTLNDLYLQNTTVDSSLDGPWNHPTDYLSQRPRGGISGKSEIHGESIKGRIPTRSTRAYT